MNAKKYNNTKLIIGIAKTVLSFIIVLFFVMSGLSKSLELSLSEFVSGDYFVFILFVISAGMIISIIFSPLNFYSGFVLEHKYNLSNQTFFKWLFEDLKEAAVSFAIGLPILLFFFFSINRFGSMWWLPFAIILFVVSVILARIIPVLILPLFYKLTPIEDEELRKRIASLSESAGIKVQNIYKFNMSKDTKKANAAFTGIGKSKRILLSDTLLENYSHDEIETVVAHELGHYEKKHITKNIIIGTVFSFLTLFIIAGLYEISIEWFGFNSITQIAALPLLVLWGMLVGLVLSPISNMISRGFEYEADEYAVASTGKLSAFINTLEKLTEQNLGDKEPHPVVEWFFYSHPSIKKRINEIFRFAGKTEMNTENPNVKTYDIKRG